MLPIEKPEQVLHRAVFGDLLPGDPGGVDDVPGAQLLPQALGEVGHLRKVRHAPVEPAEHLQGPELGQPRLGKLLLKLGEGFGFDVSGV